MTALQSLLEEIRKSAEGAEKESWREEQWGNGSSHYATSNVINEDLALVVAQDIYRPHAVHIARCDPATILRLVEMIETAREALESGICDCFLNEEKHRPECEVARNGAVLATLERLASEVKEMKG
jgi:hypothetical protein